MRRSGRTPIPPTNALRLLERNERARLLLLIAKAVRDGRKVQSGDRRYCKTLIEDWPGMLPENQGDNPEDDPWTT